MKIKNLLFILLTIQNLTFVGAQSFYDYKVKTIDGEDFSFSQLKGKKVLVVNTASKCGFTPQYEDLEVLYKKYGGEDFTVIGFPANNFMN